jgi:hypothetical protein
MLAHLGGNRDDLTGGDWVFILGCAGVLVGVAVLVAIPCAISNRRRNRQGELILAGALFWGLGAAWTGLGALVAQWNWSKERMTLLLGGYYKTVASDPGPRLPWGWWTLLAALYLVLLGLSLRRGGIAQDGPGARTK